MPQLFCLKNRPQDYADFVAWWGLSGSTSKSSNKDGTWSFWFCRLKEKKTEIYFETFFSNKDVFPAKTFSSKFNDSQSFDTKFFPCSIVGRCRRHSNIPPPPPSPFPPPNLSPQPNAVETVWVVNWSSKFCFGWKGWLISRKTGVLISLMLPW